MLLALNSDGFPIKFVTRTVRTIPNECYYCLVLELCFKEVLTFITVLLSLAAISAVQLQAQRSDSAVMAAAACYSHNIVETQILDTCQLKVEAGKQEKLFLATGPVFVQLMTLSRSSQMCLLSS